MDVRRSNFAQVLEVIAAALPEAEFVAIDLEFTGIQAASEPDSYADTPLERLEKTCRIVETFAPIQLGITICSTAQKLSSYSIMMAPESTFLCDVGALKFVRAHNVDLNAWVDEGVRHISHQEAVLPAASSICQEGLLEPLLKIHEQARGTTFLCQAERLRAERRRGLDLNEWVEAQQATVGSDSARFGSLPSSGSGSSPEDWAERQVGLPRLWEMLKRAGKPIVVHCGLPDVLFLLSAFEQRVLPRDPAKLAKLLKDCLPSGVYDTAYLHESVGDLRLRPLGLHSFANSAREHHKRRHGCELQFTLERLTAERYGSGLRSECEELAHEAGYDSFLTTVLFSYLKESHSMIVKQSLNRFYLYKSTDCLQLSHLRCPASGKGTFAIKVYDSERLVVAELLSEDAQKHTTSRISEARREERENAFYYRKMDEWSLLIPGCEEAKLIALSSRLRGVKWTDFYTWQKQARATRSGLVRPPDRERQFIGMIKSFNREKGYGFISCQDTSRIYDCDVFLHQHQASGFQEGQHVRFVVVCNDKGQPQARDVEECIFSGVIRSFDGQSRCISISCPVTFRMYGSDVSMPGHFPQVQVGEPVSFSVVLVQGQLVAQRLFRTRPTELQPARLQQNLQNHSYSTGVPEFTERAHREPVRSAFVGNSSGLRPQAPGPLNGVRLLVST